MDRSSVLSSVRQKVFRTLMSVMLVIAFVPMGTAYAADATEADEAFLSEEVQASEESPDGMNSDNSEIAAVSEATSEEEVASEPVESKDDENQQAVASKANKPKSARAILTATVWTNGVGVTYDYTVTDSGTAKIVKCKSTPTTVVIPSNINGYMVTEIGQEAFKGCTSLRTLTLPTNLSYISWGAFAGCFNLYSVTVNSRDLDCYGSDVFENAGALASNGISVTFGSSCLYVPGYMFSGSSVSVAPKVKKVTINSGVKEIGGYAFRNCSTLDIVNIYGSTLTSIGNGSFMNTSIPSVSLPSSLSEIGSEAFSGCTSFKTLTLPSNLGYIDWDAFAGCTNLSSVTVNSRDLDCYGSDVFENAGDLTTGGITVKFGSNCRYIPSYMFSGSSVNAAPNIKKVTFDSGVKEIGNCAFSNCSNLNSVVINGATLTSIGSSAFEGCGVSSIVLPSSLKSIGYYAFNDCTKLSSVKIPSKVDYIGSGAFHMLAYPSKIYASTVWQYETLNSDYYVDLDRTTVYLPIYKYSISLSASSLVYNGKARTPSVTVKNGHNVLTRGEDYTVVYPAGRKNVGKYTVTIKGKGGLTGSATRAFTIRPKAAPITSLSRLNNGFKVKWAKRTVQVTGYELAYKRVGTNGWTTKKIANYKTNFKSITGLRDKKTYQVKVRTYKTVNGVKYYSAWTGIKTVTTK